MFRGKFGNLKCTLKITTNCLTKISKTYNNSINSKVKYAHILLSHKLCLFVRVVNQTKISLCLRTLMSEGNQRRDVTQYRKLEKLNFAWKGFRPLQKLYKKLFNKNNPATRSFLDRFV